MTSTKSSEISSAYSDFQQSITVKALAEVSTPKALTVILSASVLAVLLLVWIIYLKPVASDPDSWVYWLPAVNSTLNSISAVLILLGYVAIRRRNFKMHMGLMLAAFVASSLFLVSYLVYHNAVGDTPFPGQGWIRPVYFFILISHILLSVSVVPLVLTTYFFAFAGRFKTHRSIARWTFPIWLYVSVTGVVIYFLLRAYL